MARQYILLDRDGTIIVDKHYLHDPDEVELLPGVVEGLQRMRDMGFGLAVLTNQSGVERGYYDEASVNACNGRMEALLQPHGVSFDGIYYCRKPATGLMEQAALALGFNPGESVMIGDKEADMLLGRAVGAMTILVRTGKGAAHEERCHDSADHVVDSLVQAAEIMENMD